ncbi:PREDICTED: class I histocompatibility antigen, F10 alpha chain-like, partial [Tauraco erythrolophus]|uniref:class I histocompatibility antigen, F10 alpha chain-like n=1 Tax=Tauraco erythrolophus TaxID=121530 RepID=UPI000523E8E2
MDLDVQVFQFVSHCMTEHALTVKECRVSVAVLRPPLSTISHHPLCPTTERYLRYFEATVSNPSPGVPQFTAVGYVDGNLISRYDSETGRAVPGSGWMAASLDQPYWDTQTGIGRSNQHIFRERLLTLRARYSESG